MFPLDNVYELGSSMDFVGCCDIGCVRGGGGGAVDIAKCESEVAVFEASGDDTTGGGGGGAAGDAAGDGGPLPKAFLAACIAND